MKRVLLALCALVLMAASPGEVLVGLEANGYYIEPGSSADEQVVSDAVFEGRADGGRLYIVVLSEEPPGGATTFADSALDLLDGEGYVVTVAPDTVGFAGDGSFWSRDQMDDAIDASLEATSDNAVVQLFISRLTGQTTGGGDDPGAPAGGGGSSPGGISFGWVVAVAIGALVVWMFMRRGSGARRSAQRLGQIKGLARQKLAEVANDILEMEDEVAVAGNQEAKAHYERASAVYGRAIENTEKASTATEMLEVSEELDVAIWELDCAEAILDGKPIPPRPEPPRHEPVVMPPAGRGTPVSSPVPGTVPPVPGYDRRPQRQSSGSNEMLTMLLTMLAMGGGDRGGFGGNWTRSGGGAPRPPIGGGGGAGRIRGGGRRRG